MNTAANNMILTPADFADTGQWRLLIYINSNGMCAYLKDISDRSRPVVEMFNSRWDAADNDSILHHIENAVYDNPGLLDDFATDIIIDTNYTTLVPSQIVNEEILEDEIFHALYPVNNMETMTDYAGAATVIFSLCNGLESFLSRTLPGCRIRNNLAILIENFYPKVSDTPRIYVDIKDNSVNIFAFDSSRLLAASCRRWRNTDDISYFVYHLLDAYSLPPESSEIYIAGPNEIRQPLTESLRRFCGYVVRMNLPEISEKYNLPTALGLLMAK